MVSAKIVTDSHRSLFFLFVLTAVASAGLWFDDVLGSVEGSVVEDIRNSGPNEAAANKATQNYYGELLASENEDGGGIDVLPVEDAGGVPESRNETIQKSGATNNRTRNFLPWELVPGSNVIFKGVPLVVNRFGNCDGDGYTREKPEGTFRIALCGGSNTMGSGVAIEDTFGSLVQDRLNRELAGNAYDHYEIINFAVGGYHFPESLYVVENKVGDFDPDLLLINATDKDLTIQHERLARRVYKHEPIHFRFLEKIIKDAGLNKQDSLNRMVRQLYPYREDILLGCVNELSRYAEKSGTETAIFLLRRDGGPRVHPELLQTLEVLQQGDLTVLPLFESYDGVGPMELWLIPNENPELGDPHPNIEGHRRIADDLYSKLMADETIGAMLHGQAPRPKRRAR